MYSKVFVSNFFLTFKFVLQNSSFVVILLLLFGGHPKHSKEVPGDT